MQKVVAAAAVRNVAPPLAVRMSLPEPVLTCRHRAHARDFEDFEVDDRAEAGGQHATRAVLQIDPGKRGKSASSVSM